MREGCKRRQALPETVVLDLVVMALSFARPQNLRVLGLSRAFSSIPINKVARVYRFHVDGEETAAKMDDLVKRANEKLKTVNGYEKYVRTVCKSEWAYEFSLIFGSLDAFKAYDGGEFRQKELMPLLKESISMMKEDAPYSGVRVYDEE